jgi:N-acylneuraminate cytidylyltransferase
VTRPNRPSPEVVAVIPARGGSKGVPGKNLRRVGGRPLVARAVDAAHAAGIDTVYVSTDDTAIAAAARAAGARVIERPADIAGDTASSESALLHALDELADEDVLPRVLVFLQATSPFIPVEPLRRAVQRVLRGDEDVVLSAFETYAFLWAERPDGAVGVNHDAGARPRRQDREPHLQETGAFYVLDVAGFARARFRFFGRVGIERVPEASAIEIDSPEQLELARGLVPHVGGAAADPSLDVDAIVMDFDGVHTDDSVIVDQHGTESVRVSRSDGFGLERLRKAGVTMLILSKERNDVVAARGRKLGIEVMQGVEDKGAALAAWCSERGLDPQRVAYVGNDVTDAPCLRMVGVPVVVPDAHPSVIGLARIVLSKPGGSGALRELAEMVLAARKEEDTND